MFGSGRVMVELFRYAAFISYASKDEKFARRLHRSLEGYGIPKSVGDFDLTGGGRKNRIYPVFRDREELSAGDLDARIEAALRASAALIIVCSPNAATSLWVQKEIEFFISLGRRDRVFCIIADTAPIVDEESTPRYFPSALRDGGSAEARTFEPLAGDARKGKDGFRRAWLKIVAGLVGVTPGQLIDRDLRRRRLQVSLASFATLAAIVLTGVAGGVLLSARLQERSLTLAQLARSASDAGFYDRAARYAAAGMRGATLPVVGYDTTAASAELRRALAGPLRSVVAINTADEIGRAFSPDGRLFVQSRDADDAVIIRDAATGAIVQILRGHLQPVYFCSFSPRGDRVVTAARDGAVRVWEVATGREIFALTGVEGQVDKVAFSLDQRRAVLMFDDTHPPILWRLGSSESPVSLRGHQVFENISSVWDASFSQDGSRIVTSGRDMTARIWDGETGRELLVLPSRSLMSAAFGAGTPVSALFSPSGRLIVTMDGEKVRIWDVASARQLAEFPARVRTFWSRQAVFSPDGALLVVLSEGRAIVFHADTEVAIFGEGLTSVSFAADSKRVVTGSANGEVSVWQIGPVIDLSRYPQIINVPANTRGVRERDLVAEVNEIAVLRGHTGSIGQAFVSAENSRILSVSSDGTARTWDIGPEPSALQIPESPAVTVLNSEGTRLLTTSYNEAVARIWDLRSGREVLRLTGHAGSVVAATFSRDGTRVLTGDSEGVALVWNALTGQRLQTFSGHAGGAVRVASFNSDATRAVTAANEDRMVRIWDVSSGRELSSFQRTSVVGAKFSPDDAFILTVGDAYDHATLPVQAWDGASARAIEGGALLEDFPSGNLAAAAFSPDLSRIVVADGGAARVWDIASGRQLVALVGHQTVEQTSPTFALIRQPPRALHIASVAFSSDGNRIVTGSEDGSARVWDAMTGRQLARFGAVAPANQFSFPDDMQTASFSNDGSRVVTSDRSGRVRVWTLPPSVFLPQGDLLRIACDGVLVGEGGRFTSHEYSEAPVLDSSQEQHACAPPSLLRWLVASSSNRLQTSNGR